jgi:hypothetical protein
LSIVC